jgi:endonuclease/exonuclease/phosphatase family metal-dependent hydrolase
MNVSGSPRADDPVDWVRAESPELARWRSAVGPPLAIGPPATEATEAEALVFGVWNTNVGAADLGGFVGDLLAGRLTESAGRPIVLLLQEVHRGGGTVPDRPPHRARGARRIHGRPPSGERLDIHAVAARFDLHLYYVPSMRNGTPGEDGTPEDRGNAILSTLPISGLRAFELPFERQRRVAISASVSGIWRGGERFTLNLVNVHLDPRSGGWRTHRSFGAGRAHQARWLAGALAHDAPTVIGGDLNTWFRGRREPAVAHLQSRFPLPEGAPRAGTRPVLRGLRALELDHVFVRAPWRADYRMLADAYGSDHFPLVGRLRPW